MARTIPRIEEEDDTRAKRASWWGEVAKQSCNPCDAIQKRDLSPKQIDCLDRTETVAKSAIGQVELASPTDQMRESIDVSKTKPAGTNAVTTAAESAGLKGSPKIQSVFDLSSNMGKRAPVKSDSRPELELPRTPADSSDSLKNYLRLVLDVHGSMEKIITDCTNHLDANTRHDIKELGKLREEKVKAIEDYARELANKESWATLETLISWIAYASAVSIGVSIGGPAGYLLIAAGGLGIAGSLASQAGLWTALAAHLDKSEETQKHIVQSIEFATTLIPLGLGLLGSSLASPMHAPTAFTWMAAALSTSSKLGTSWAEKKHSYVLAELEKLDRSILLVREHAKSTSNHMRETLLKARQITEEVEKILSNSEVSLS